MAAGAGVAGAIGAAVCLTQHEASGPAAAKEIDREALWANRARDPKWTDAA